MSTSSWQMFKVGNYSIPFTEPKKRRNRRSRRRGRGHSRQRTVSNSSANEIINSHQKNSYHSKTRNDERNDGGYYGKDYRTRTESFGVQSNISRTTNDSTSRPTTSRGRTFSDDYSKTNWKSADNQNQDQNRYLRWDRDRLSRQIWDYYQDHSQTPDLMTRKTHLKEALHKIMTTHFKNYDVDLYIVGSTANGLASNHSDMDICLVMNAKISSTPVGQLVDTSVESKESGSPDEKKAGVATAVIVDIGNDSNDEAKEQMSDKLNTSSDTITTTVSTNGKSDPSIPMLEKIRDVLQCYNFVEKLQVILAKVPILKFVDRISGIEVTLNVNKLVSIRNTHLIRDYTRIDWRLQPLVMVIKAWAKDHGIKDAYNKSISSYSLVLMIIHYLQYGCDPPVLPCLQRLDPERYASDTDVRQLYRRKRWTRKWKSRNTLTLKDLFIGFLDYYSYAFCYDTDAISVRLGHVIPKNKFQSMICPYLCVEEPFNRTNTAHSVYDRVIFERIVSVFRVSHYTLRRYPFLGSIMTSKRFANETVGRPDVDPLLPFGAYTSFRRRNSSVTQ